MSTGKDNRHEARADAASSSVNYYKSSSTQNTNSFRESTKVADSLLIDDVINVGESVETLPVDDTYASVPDTLEKGSDDERDDGAQFSGSGRVGNVRPVPKEGDDNYASVRDTEVDEAGYLVINVLKNDKNLAQPSPYMQFNPSEDGSLEDGYYEDGRSSVPVDNRNGSYARWVVKKDVTPPAPHHGHHFQPVNLGHGYINKKVVASHACAKPFPQTEYKTDTPNSSEPCSEDSSTSSNAAYQEFI